MILLWVRIIFITLEGRLEAMNNGYCGKYLRVNLSLGEIKEEHFSEKVLRNYIGGSGLGAKIICEETDENTDPLGPDNVLTFFTGPLVGTAAPNFGRYQATAKSPLTDSFGEGNSGGSWGTILKHAGLDGIIFNGASSKPVYLYIEDGVAELKDASELWGLDTFETDTKLKSIHGNKAVSLTIGPAGENLVKIACIINDGTDARTIGRCGLGAVMGSKKLKAVTVVGTGRPNVANQEKLKASVLQWAKTIHSNMEGMNKYGTSGGVEGAEKIGDLPIKNWMEGSFDVSDLTGQVQAEKILTKKYYCRQCVIG
ncbi:MAG: aldehyde ferredoxin oxidoreductase N-terminal domain-containing protein, partial [Thermacetogeniaceae bacterium]